MIIPPKGRDALLRELHDTHRCIVKMKALTRSYLWWPGLDTEIERHVKDCNACHECDTPQTSTDIFLNMTTPHHCFRQWGCFTSDEFEQFYRANGIKHVRCSPYHPSSNGVAVRAVQTVKFGFRKTKGNLEDRLARYRVTPQGTTGRAPAEFMLKTPPQTRFDLLRLSVQDKVLQKQAYNKHRHDTHAAARTFTTGDSAWALNFHWKPKWMPTVIENQLGPLTFTVPLNYGRVWKRHQYHLRERRPDETESVGAEQQRPEVLLPPPPQLTSTDMERYVTPLTSATIVFWNRQWQTVCLQARR